MPHTGRPQSMPVASPMVVNTSVTSAAATATAIGGKRGKRVTPAQVQVHQRGREIDVREDQRQDRRGHMPVENTLDIAHRGFRRCDEQGLVRAVGKQRKRDEQQEAAKHKACFRGRPIRSVSCVGLRHRSSLSSPLARMPASRAAAGAPSTLRAWFVHSAFSTVSNSSSETVVNTMS